MTQAQWTIVASFGTVLEADIARQTLEAAGIPVLVKGDVPGIFGSGFQGAVPSGVSLSVPDPEVARARELLD